MPTLCKNILIWTNIDHHLIVFEIDTVAFQYLRISIRNYDKFYNGVYNKKKN